MEISQQLTTWADELRAISGNGLQFSKNPYDEANYEHIRRIAAEMFAVVDGRSPLQVHHRLLELLGHYTPMAMGDALVINDAGQMLLIQRSDSKLWASPGGAFDVGETAAEGVVRECLEETGWRVAPVALIGVYDSRVVNTLPGQHVFHFSFLCRPLHREAGPPSHGQEALDMGWFAEDDLPPLDVGHRVWVPNAFRFWRGDLQHTYFDRASPESDHQEGQK